MSVQRENNASGTYVVPGFNPGAPYPVIDPLANPVNGVRFDPSLIKLNIQQDYYENVDNAAFQCWFKPWSCNVEEDDPDIPPSRAPNRNVEVQESSETMKALLIGGFLIVGIIVIRRVL